MADHVAIPQTADEAALMVLTGVAWLKEHAPERLSGDEHKKDAERYRWFRAQCNTRTNLVQYKLGDWACTIPCNSAKDMDAAIDAAMANAAAVGAA